MNSTPCDGPSREDLSSVVVDLSRRLEAQEETIRQLQASEQNLKDLNTRKDRLFGIIAHDVRNMLVSAMGFAKLLYSDADTLPRAMVKEFSEHVFRSTTNTLDLLENLLTWTRIQTGRLPCQRALHPVNELIENNLATFKPNAAHKGIAMTYTPGQNVLVYADRNMINSVLQNLLSNALKYTRRGGAIEVFSRVDGEQVDIAVQDFGMGISEDNQKKLFRIDMHFSLEGTEQEEGTGLGLVLCKEMIERQGGTIWVDSKLGQGTTFTFRLPCLSANTDLAQE